MKNHATTAAAAATPPNEETFHQSASLWPLDADQELSLGEPDVRPEPSTEAMTIAGSASTSRKKPPQRPWRTGGSISRSTG